MHNELTINAQVVLTQAELVAGGAITLSQVRSWIRTAGLQQHTLQHCSIQPYEYDNHLGYNC